jgi:hypothetical protein
MEESEQGSCEPMRLLTILAAVLASSAVAVGSASASTVEDCQTALATLRANTVAAETSFANQNSFESAVAKLYAAAAKLAEGKSADAVQKLADFQTSLNALATAARPKLDPAVAQALTAEAQGVVDCINSVGSTEKASCFHHTWTRRSPASAAGLSASSMLPRLTSCWRSAASHRA